jgi:hypothetical protein
MKPIGFIVEQKNTFTRKDGKIFEEWVHFSRKIYKSIEVAEDAYKQSPYKSWDGYNVAGRIIPVYQQENEEPLPIN